MRTSKVPDFMTEDGLHHLTIYDNPEVVEFSFEYSFDKKQAKWGNCRNKVYVNTIDVKHQNLMVTRNPNGKGKHTYLDPYYLKKLNPSKSNEYSSLIGHPDFSEVDRIDAINQEKFKKHNRQLKTANIITSIAMIPMLGIGLFRLANGAAYEGCVDTSHQPPQ